MKTENSNLFETSTVINYYAGFRCVPADFSLFYTPFYNYLDMHKAGLTRESRAFLTRKRISYQNDAVWRWY